MNKSIFLTTSKTTTKQIKALNLNFGPQHPAAHGVLRLILQMNNEVIENADPHIGLLHRGTEKLMETKMYIHSLPYFDRLDYVSVLIQEHAYCLVLEKALQTVDNYRNFNLVRTLYDELTRILNHLLAIACHALDVGAMSPIFWGFEEREKIMEFYERVSGARMHAAFYRPNKINIKRISWWLLEDILEFTVGCTITLNEINTILLYNKIWKNRLIHVGQYTADFALNAGFTGVMARATGIAYDLRLCEWHSYSSYFTTVFKSFLGVNGDSYDRYLIRISEMFESLYIIAQLLDLLKDEIKKTWVKIDNSQQFEVENPYNSMEELIRHFKYWTVGFVVPTQLLYSAVESPKGEFGVTLIADNTNQPYRCKVRSPAYFHLQALPALVKNMLLADLITLIGTIDIVFGEIDR